MLGIRCMRAVAFEPLGRVFFSLVDLGFQRPNQSNTIIVTNKSKQKSVLAEELI